LYHATHNAFGQSQIRQSIPLEPKWLIEAMGLPHFSATDTHYGPVATPDGRMKLFTIHQTVSGRQTRVTLLAASSGLIEQQAMYDANNRLIAYINSSNYKNYPEQNLSLPQTIELNMIQPDGQMAKIEVDMGTYSINSLYGDPNKMWAKPTPPGSVRTIDLAQVSNQNSAANQAQPQYRQPQYQRPQQPQYQQPQSSPYGQQQGSAYQPRFLPAAQSSGSGLR